MSGWHIAFGSLPYDLAHVLGGMMLVLSFALLSRRRLGAAIDIYAAQSVLLAVAAASQAYAQDSANLYLTAAVTLGAKGIAMPIGLRFIVRRLRIGSTIERSLDIVPSLLLGVGLVTLAVLVVLPVTPHAGTLTREDLAAALSVILLGLLIMTTLRGALTQVLGLLSMENGIILAAVGIGGMPLVAELSVATLILMGFFVVGIWFFRIRERFDSDGLAHLDQTSSPHR